MDPRLIAEFNRLFEMQYDRVRDFLVLHYTANERHGEPLWDHVRTMALPDTLRHKIEMFEARAAAPDYIYGLFSRDSWLSVLIGQRLEARGYDHLADALALDDVQTRLADLKARIEVNAAAMTSHADFIAHYCRAAPPPRNPRWRRDERHGGRQRRRGRTRRGAVARGQRGARGARPRRGERDRGRAPEPGARIGYPRDAAAARGAAHLLGIDEAALLRATRGSFSLGQNFTHADGAMPAFFHAHGAYGAQIERRDFFPFWLKARRFGLGAAFEDFSLTAAAARHGRMLIPSEAIEAFGRADYGYHLPAAAYARALKALAANDGIESYQAETAHAILDPETGDIRAVEIGGGRRIAGRLFIDASGSEAMLLGDALGVGRESWRAHFPADRILAARAPQLASIPPYAEIRAWDQGWLGLFSSQARTHVVHAYASAQCGDDEALEAATRISGLALADPVVDVSDPGRRRVAWQPIASRSARRRAGLRSNPRRRPPRGPARLVHLLGLFPAGSGFAAERAQYNQTMQSLFEHVRDFQAAYYVVNREGDAPFWARARAAAAPPELAHRIATFAARGEIAPYENESFSPDSWRADVRRPGVDPRELEPGDRPHRARGDAPRVQADPRLHRRAGDRATDPRQYLESHCRRGPGPCVAPPPCAACTAACRSTTCRASRSARRRRRRRSPAIVAAETPVVLEGLVEGWPALAAGRASPAQLNAYLKAMDGGAPAPVMEAPARHRAQVRLRARSARVQLHQAPAWARRDARPDRGPDRRARRAVRRDPDAAAGCADAQFRAAEPDAACLARDVMPRAVGRRRGAHADAQRSRSQPRPA